MRLAERVVQQWYRPSLTLLTGCLLPLSLIFGVLVRARGSLYSRGWLKKTVLPVPVIVVGNLTVGGTGKTPVVIWLADMLRAQGYCPGIIARGVGGTQQRDVQSVMPDSSPFDVGDEAVLLARRSGCPVWVATDRVRAAESLLRETDCNVIVSDDGLQHYRLGRAFEVIIVDGARTFGNGAMLPAGPLREPKTRLSVADVVFVRGEDFILQGSELAAVHDPDRRRPLADFAGQTVHAVAGIGHPENFFADLRAQGITVIPHIFPDHFAFKKKDIFFHDELPVIMTEKDAVKCHAFAGDLHWCLPVSVCPGEKMLATMRNLIWSSKIH